VRRFTVLVERTETYYVDVDAGSAIEAEEIVERDPEPAKYHKSVNRPKLKREVTTYAVADKAVPS